MTYQATVINVMIASPSDIKGERVIARQIMDNWNAVNSEDRKAILQAIGWDTHSSPAMGDRPQAIINSQILDRADLLVAIFWTRLGTDTGEFESGTVEEIEKHVNSGKPAMIYFSSGVINPELVDPTQYAAVRRFRESLLPRVFVHDYETADQFRADFSQHLGMTIIREFSTESSRSTATATQEHALGTDAATLLIEATEDERGIIMRIQSNNGLHVSTNQQSFIDGGRGREAAKWEAAIEELESFGLIKPTNWERSLFEVTNRGYTAVEDNRKQDDPSPTT